MPTPSDPEDMAKGVEPGLESLLTSAMNAAIDRYEQEDVLALPDTFRPDLEALLSELWLEASAAGGETVVDEFRSYGFEHLETKADEQDLFERIRDMYVERYGAAKVTHIFETTRNQLLQMILQGQQDGLTVDQIATQLRASVPQLSRLRASTIARTETHSSNRFAQQQTARESRRALNKTWVSVADPRTRDFGEGGDGIVDEFSHRAMNGVRVPLEQPYFVSTKFGTKEPLMFPGDPNGSAGNIINCFMPDTLVVGRFEAATRSLYRGDVIEIKTRGGRNLTVTPNHPIVANGGMVPAHKVREGDNLVAYLGEVKDTARISDKNINLGPSTAKDIFAAFVKAGETRRTGVIGVDFHGDGYFIEGDIEIVLAEWHLTGTRDAPVCQFLDDVSLIEADTVTNHTTSTLSQALVTVRHAANGVMSVLGKALALLWSGLCHASEHRFAAVSGGASGTDNSAADSSSFNADIGSNTFYTFPSFMPFTNQGIGDAGQAPPSDYTGLGEDLISARIADAERFSHVLDLHSGVVESDGVVSVIRKGYSGHVYDFQEVSGLMIAGGILTSNCRCAETYRRADRPEG